VLERLRGWVLGQPADEDEIPVCPDHRTQMVLFRKLGKPARFSDQETEAYDLIFRCPVPGCDNTALRQRFRTQIPVPGEVTDRPAWAERQRKSF
jgi:hypothetical protein